MYEYIKGNLVALTPTYAVVEASGVGYGLQISLTTHGQIEGQERVKLFVHQYVVQQDAPLFYGFATAVERDLFRMLISISGIGGNTARVMLSSHQPLELVNIIANGDVVAIERTKGIGSKTAQRVVLELKSKVVSLHGTQEVDGVEAPMTLNTSLEEAISALTVLGFTRAAVERVARKIHSSRPTITAEELIRESLANL
ncbi:MAG: Holliday junction branch migration protein RuvA [Mucinivorans sp.]